MKPFDNVHVSEDGWEVHVTREMVREVLQRHGIEPTEAQIGDTAADVAYMVSVHLPMSILRSYDTVTAQK